MFTHIKNFNKIVVIGPQRSGTRIAAKMIAKSLDCKFFSELVVGIRSFGRLKRLLTTVGGRFVVQCPGLTARVHDLELDDKTLIVFMRRSVEDVLASQERINWQGHITEEREYERHADHFDADDPICVKKFKVWDKFQKPLIKHHFDLEYDSLSKHPLWIPKTLRRAFGPGQIDFSELEASSDKIGDKE